MSALLCHTRRPDTLNTSVITGVVDSELARSVKVVIKRVDTVGVNVVADTSNLGCSLSVTLNDRVFVVLLSNTSQIRSVAVCAPNESVGKG